MKFIEDACNCNVLLTLLTDSLCNLIVEESGEGLQSQVHFFQFQDSGMRNL